MVNISHSFDNSIIRSYDIRGVFNKTLFEKDARVIGQLFGLKVGKNNTVNIGYDGRHSSKPLKESLNCWIFIVGKNDDIFSFPKSCLDLFKAVGVIRTEKTI